MDAVIEILKGLDYSPLYVSLKTGIVATIFSFFLGLFAARKVIKAGSKVKAIADGILTLPMVLPPTAAGFFLLLLFSRDVRLEFCCMRSLVSRLYRLGQAVSSQQR